MCNQYVPVDTPAWPDLESWVTQHLPSPYLKEIANGEGIYTLKRLGYSTEEIASLYVHYKPTIWNLLLDQVLVEGEYGTLTEMWMMREEALLDAYITSEADFQILLVLIALEVLAKRHCNAQGNP